MAHLTHLRQRYTEKIESSRENRVGGGEQSILQTSKHAHYYILQQTSIQIARPSLSLLSSGNCALPEKTRSLLLKLMRIPPVLCGTFDMRLLTNNGVSDLLLFKEAVSNGHKGSLFHIAFNRRKSIDTLQLLLPSSTSDTRSTNINYRDYSAVSCYRQLHELTIFVS